MEGMNQDTNPSLDMGNGGTNLNPDSGLDRGNVGMIWKQILVLIE